MFCKNGGQCENIESDGLIGFKCNCTSKYSGQLCEISILIKEKFIFLAFWKLFNNKKTEGRKD